MNAQKILTDMRVPLHLDVFMFSTRPMDCACVQTSRRVSGTHLFLPTTTRFCDLARARAYNIEKISNDAKRKGNLGLVLALELILVSWDPCALGDEWVEFGGMMLTYFAQTLDWNIR